MKILSILLLILPFIWACGTNSKTSEPKMAEAVALKYFNAVKSNDLVKLKEVSTEELFAQFKVLKNNSKTVNNLISSMGVNLPSMKDAEIISLKCDSIKDDVAYINAEIKLNGESSFEKMVLKKVLGKWKVAGKQ